MSDRRRANLTLIGTVHRDPRGYERLSALLERLRPRRLTLEMSPAALLYRQKRAGLLSIRLETILNDLADELGRSRKELDEHPTVTSIRTLLALPFEYRAAVDFAERRGASLALIDDSAISTAKLKKVESELITPCNLRILVGLPSTASDHRSEGYQTAKQLIFGPFDPPLNLAYLQGRRGREGIGGRDRGMAEEIRRQLEGGARGPLAHIGGWVHLMEDPLGETLFSLLDDLQPRRLLLE
ncbi:hypothetical protein DSOUD_3567 [Desulfuromonas soudanensis]|uniref:TraB family protein n=1 Tax=Desulfuromonas soudanensis TaxID=1603606 RepID=A0A0M5IS42_9BACT|nr:hypothetical protein [Desulfuromonas soudanensis]ALC18281.1 hypothetical protein DSOUD_3567 [Desulfuromonas soudanensis]